MNRFGVVEMGEAPLVPPREYRGELYPGFRLNPGAPLEYQCKGLMGIICALWNQIEEDDTEAALRDAQQFIGGAIAVVLSDKPGWNPKALVDLKFLVVTLEVRQQMARRI